jgi:peptidoglycan hydrolase CwlO-like protein
MEITQKQWELFCERGEKIQSLKEILEVKEHTINSLMGEIEFLRQDLQERNELISKLQRGVQK